MPPSRWSAHHLTARSVPERPRYRWARPTAAALTALALTVAVAPGATSAEKGPATTTLRGTYEQLVSDPVPEPPDEARRGAEPTSEQQDVVRLDDGTRVEVVAEPGLLADVVPGQRIEVVGTPAPAGLTQSPTSSAVLASEVTALSPAPAPAAHDVDTVAIVLLRLAGGVEPVTPDDARRVLLTDPDSVAAYYDETSWGQLGLRGRDRPDGDVYGYLEIPADTSCWGEEQAGSAALQAAGIDLSGYDRVAFLLDSGTRGCWYGGWAWIGGQVSVNLWSGDAATRAIVAHELGHNLGMTHATALSCTTADGLRTPIEVDGGTCVVDEYGDPFDVMGSAYNLMQLSANHKAQLGWVPPENVVTASGTGTYTLGPSEVAGTVPQELRIPLPFGRYYSLDVRRPYGQHWDAKVADYPALLNGVTLRRSDGWTTTLIDTEPSTWWFDDAPLQLGATFTDAAAGVAVRVEAVGPDSATVHVDLGVQEPQVAVRGTSTGWASVPMTHVDGTTTWTLDTTFGADPDERFSFDVLTAEHAFYGDTERDGVADLGGPDIPVVAPDRYTITFDTATLRYSVVRTGTPGGGGSGYPTMTLRGTSTDWLPVAMTRTGEHTWQVSTVAGAHPVEEFVLDVDGTGAITFGDADADGVAEPGGPPIPFTQGPAWYLVTFDDATLEYTVGRQ